MSLDNENFFDTVVIDCFKKIKNEYESNYNIKIIDKKNRVPFTNSGFIMSIEFKNKKDNKDVLLFEIENEASSYEYIKYTFHNYEFNLVPYGTFDKKLSDLNMNDIYEKFKFLKK